MTVADVILFVFAAISVPLYLVILTMLIINRNEGNFKSAFYKIFISLGIIDMCQIVNSYFTIRCPLLGYFKPLYESNRVGLLPKYSCFSLWFFVYAQFFANFILAINRYTAFRYFWKLEHQIWTPRRTQIAYLLPWILGGIIAFYCWFQDARYSPIRDIYNNTVSYAVELSSEAYIVNSIVAKVVIVSVTVLTFLVYTLAAVNLRKTSKTLNKSASVQKGLAVELRLLFCALLIFSSMLIYAVYQMLLFIVLSLDKNDLRLVLYQWWYFVSDQFTLINPWSILATSKMVRHGLLKIFGWKPKTVDVNSIAPITF